MLLNATAGLLALRGGSMAFPFGWNSFVAVLGTCMPIVWPRFLAEGLATWPYIIVFIWFAIFAFELTEVSCGRHSDERLMCAHALPVRP